MRVVLALTLALIATPALAQFPPPGVYDCDLASGERLGVLTLLVAGDYRWDTPDGMSVTGQVTSAGSSVEALTGPLKDMNWRGDFATEMGETVFLFQTDDGPVTCKLPPL